MKILTTTRYIEVKVELVQGVDFTETDVQEYMPNWFKGAMEVNTQKLMEIGAMAGYPQIEWRGYVIDGKCEARYRRPLAEQELPDDAGGTI